MRSTIRAMVSVQAFHSASKLTDLISLTVAMPMNCSGMYRGVILEDGIPKAAIFDDDELE